MTQASGCEMGISIRWIRGAPKDKRKGRSKGKLAPNAEHCISAVYFAGFQGFSRFRVSVILVVSGVSICGNCNDFRFARDVSQPCNRAFCQTEARCPLIPRQRKHQATLLLRGACGALLGLAALVFELNSGLWARALVWLCFAGFDTGNAGIRLAG